MAASDVYSALNAAIGGSDRSIDLWQAARVSPALAGLLPVLGLFGITGSYVVNRATLSGDNSKVSLSASGRFGAAGASAEATYAVSATLAYSNDTLFALTLRVVDSRPWTFAGFFPVLPASTRSNLDDEGVKGIRWTTSFLVGSRTGYEVKLSSVSFLARSGEKQTLQIEGFLPEFADPDISGKLGLLSPWPLRLSGSIVMPASVSDYPLLRLVAQGSSSNRFSGSAVQDVSGPAPLSVDALFLEIVVERMIRPVFGNTGRSSLALGGQFAIGGGLSGVIRTQVLTAATNWVFHARFDENTSSLTQGLASLTRMFGVELPVPMDFPLLSEFHFAELDVEFRNTAQAGQTPSFSLVTLALSITSSRPWKPPVPFVTFKDVGIRWVWGSTRTLNALTNAMENSYLLTGSVFGSIQFGGDGSLPALPPPQPSPVAAELLPRVLAEDGSVTMDIVLSIPSFYITGNMRTGDYIPIGRAFAEYFRGGIPLVPATMNVTTLSFAADPIGQVYTGQARILFGTPEDPLPDQAWTIMRVGTVGIAVERLEMWVEARGGRIGGGIAGVLFLLGAGATAYDSPQLRLSAERPANGEAAAKGWLFAANLYPGTSIDLTQMVARFIMGDPNYQVPDYVPHLLIDRMDASFATGTGAYTFKGTASMRWTPELFGTALAVNASASADIVRAASGATVTGTLSGSFAVNKIAIMVAMDIGVAEPTYLLKVMFGELWVQATTAWRGAQDKRHQVVSVQLGGITLGDILEYLVNLAAPTLGFSLDPPWDLLKRVDLSRFVLTIDPQENLAEFTFDAQVSLGVMRVDTIGARYRRGTGQGKVELILTGDFFGQQYSSADPLGWDVVDGTPPSVPGQGSKTVDLRFLGFGQRITFAGATPDTVAAGVAALRKAMRKPEPGKQPVGTGLVYAEQSQWLMGLDIGLMGMIDLGIIFNDPRLYGLSVALGGERAGSLAGLRFEILYKKITNDIGMYRIELRVPDAFRTIQLGAVSLTLGIIVVEVYSNGNFKIDLGFPYDRDYSRSFSLQAGIVIGRGGFYFGILNGDTSTSVPKIANGNFSPVIELGVGIAAGVGREINVGLLSGGAYVQIEVIFQGVLAWFNPTASGARSELYYHAQGVVALHGKVYGKVDFAVISASVTLEAFAQAMVVFESHRPILLEFTVGVRAEASVKILFIRVSFHFSVTLQMGFTIGSASPTPWILADAGGAGGTPRLSGRRSEVWLSSPRQAQRRTLMRQGYVAGLRRKRLALGLAAEADYVLEWKPDRLVFASQQLASLTMLPYVTVGDVPVDWSGAVPVNATPRYRVAFLLYADTGIAPDARSVAETVQRSVALSGSDPLAAELLVSALLRYALYALPDGPAAVQDSVDAAQLALLAEQLALPESATTGFAKGALNTFFHTNLKFRVGGVPSGSKPKEKGAMLFPMPPGLAWTSTQAGDRDFSSYNKIGSAYRAGVREILGRYWPEGGRGTAADDAGEESFATYLFGDFCQMLAKAAVAEAQKQFENASVEVTATMSLADAARTFASTAVACIKETGDTAQSVAARLGSTLEELLFLNPGIEATIAAAAVGAPLNPAPLLGVSPGMLAQDNPGAALAQAAWALGDVARAVGTPDTTLASLAALFNVGSVARLFGYVPPPGMGYPLGADPNLLQEGCSFALPAQTYTPPAGGGFDLTQTAATFFVRYATPDLSASTLPGAPDMPAWYAQAIAILNPGLSAAATGEGTVEIDPGIVLQVPMHYGDRTRTRGYVSVPGDTLHRIGSALVLCQDAASLALPPPLWPVFARATTASGAAFAIPAWPLPDQQGGIVVQAGETAQRLLRRLLVDAAYDSAAGWSYDWNAASAWLGTAQVLSPLAVIVLPGASISSQRAFTFQSLCDTYGLGLADIAARLSAHKGLLPDPTTLTIRQLPALTVQQIEHGVLTSKSFAGVVNQASQMLMAGLRLPGLETVRGQVVPNVAQPQPLYDLTGQQFDLAVDADPAHANALALALRVTSKVDWVGFGATFTVEPTHDLVSLGARHPDLASHNPRLRDPQTLRPGMVLFATSDDPALCFSFSNGQILAEAPATALALSTVPATPPAPQAMPLKGTSPNTYGFEHPLALQSPQALPIPAGTAAVAGYASLWPFPQGLLRRAAAGSATPYAIFAGNQPGATLDNARALAGTTYGCRLQFRIRRMDDASNRFQLLGVDTDQRGLLLQLREEIRHGSAGAATRAYLGLTPAPNAANAQGLALLDSAQACFLVKTNLSTDSQPQAQLLRAAAAGTADPVVYHADFATQLADFLLLLWEGSVVGGTGYYLGFGAALPGSAFDGQGIASLTLLAIAGAQQAAAPAGRVLATFDNCLLVAPGLEASIHSLYAECTDGSDLADVALAPPGNAGFTLVVDKPGVESAESALQDRYNTLVFWCADSTSPYTIAPAWTPALPKPDDGRTLQPWERQRLARAAGLHAGNEDARPSPYWRYQQVVPFYRFTTMAPLGASVGLPSAADDPYRGFGHLPACPVPRLTFCLSDLLGNHSQAPAVADQGVLDLTVGYTDALIGLSSWPELTTYFEVAGTKGAAQLALQLGLKAAAAVPGASQRGDGVAEAARRQSEQYARIYYQLAQGGIGAALSTSLRQVAGEQGQPIAVAPLWRYAAGAYAYTGTAAQLLPLTQPGSTLASVLQRWPVRCAELAVANQAVALNRLFAAGSQVAVPALMPFIAQRSLADLYAQRPNGWPDPGSPAALFALPENAGLPLAPGARLRLPAPIACATGSQAATPSLAQLARDHATDAGRLGELNATEALLAAANGVDPTQPNVLTATFAQEDGSRLVLRVPVVAGATDSFASVQAAFAAQGGNLGLAEIAAENADIAGLLKAERTLSNDLYIAQDGDTAGSNRSGVAAQALGAANAATPGIFDDGALVQFGSRTVALSGDTLDSVAQRYACPPDLLLACNATLACGPALAVPGVFAWPGDAAARGRLRVPYGVRSGDVLDTLCTRFGCYAGGSGTATARDCVAANAAVPGTLAKDVTLHIQVPSGDVRITTPEVESFAAAWSQAQAINPQTTLAQLADAIAGQAGALEQGALLLFPPACLAQVSAPSAMPGLYGIDGAAFALANAATPGLIAPSVPLRMPLPDAPQTVVEVVTQANDTLNSVIVRFSLKGVATDAGAIAARNAGAALFAAQAPALLPPAPVRAAVGLGAGGPYPQPVFALTAALTLSRPQALIHPDFDKQGPVAIATSPLPPHAQGDASGDGGLTFGPFIAQLTGALEDLRVGTAKVAGETADLWCVDFSARGIAEVNLLPGVQFPELPRMPRFLALAPLYDHLVTRLVEIGALDEDGTLASQTVPMQFMAIDVEPWAQRFLADLDRFLGGRFATELYARDGLRDALDGALAGKAALAEAIAGQLQAVFDYSAYETTPDPRYLAGLGEARTALAQQLDVGLLRAYDTSVVVQYDSDATTPWPDDTAPVALYGQGKLAGSSAVTFAASKTGLASKGFVGFFATVADPARHSWVRGELDYAYSHTEFDISAAGVPAGYLASNWLSLVPLQDKTHKPDALQGTNPGQVLAPVPLRIYPALPAIREQVALPTHPSVASLEQMALWTYRLTCSHEFAAQDGVKLTIEFNLAPPAQRLLRSPAPDLFHALAQYVAVADQLWTLLDTLERGGAAAANAAHTFAQLAKRIADAWNLRPSLAETSDARPLEPTVPTFAFTARVTYSASGDSIERFSLTREQAQPGPGGSWPTVEALLADGSAIAMQPNAATSAGTMVYVPQTGAIIPAADTQTFRLSWNDINVAAYQNARARMLAMRNGDLLYDPDAPSNPMLPTSPAFLLKTAEITATSIVTPLIERGTPQPIAGADVGAALAGAIQTLFPAADVVAGTTASWGVSYAYELASDAQSIGASLLSRVPVALYPSQPLAGAASALAAAVQAWTREHHPASDGGGWLFNVVLYSGLEHSARPIFSGDLFYALQAP